MNPVAKTSEHRQPASENSLRNQWLADERKKPDRIPSARCAILRCQEFFCRFFSVHNAQSGHAEFHFESKQLTNFAPRRAPDSQLVSLIIREWRPCNPVASLATV
jgi:hypothetical protein